MKAISQEHHLRYARLHQVRLSLKKEFVGLDAIIDRIVEVITPWYLFPDMQDRPTIINLWGLTGVGKSSLVNRLVSLLDFDQQYFRFDLGEAFDRESNIKKGLQTMFPHHHGKPMVIAFDEFQLARTINSSDDEVDKGFLRTVWDILDSGKVITTYNSYSQSAVFQFTHLLAFLLTSGVEIEQGMVVKGKEIYKNMLLRSRSSQFALDMETGNQEELKAIPSWYLEDIFELALGRFITHYDLEQYLATLDGKNTLRFLKEIHDRSMGQLELDCSKSLVFVLGNLDEAFSMSHEINLEISPDEFHQQSLKITINTIRKALAKRFRQEQIARLGSCHIVYPAFSKATFEELIVREVEKISAKARDFGLALCIDPSVYTLLYREGVFPTQGVRPLFTAIHELLGTQVSKLLIEQMSVAPFSTEIRLLCHENRLKKEFYQGDVLVATREEEIELTVHTLRSARRDDFQAITAVHESGHAILSMVLLKVIPEYVYSISSQDQVGGFVYTKEQTLYHAKQELKYLMAKMLGGLAAEEVVFGKEQVTTGAETDLRIATQMAIDMILTMGMGEVPGYYEHPMQQPNSALIPREQHRKLAEAWLQEAYQLALTTLAAQRVWLLQMADYLSDHPMMNKETLRDMATAYAVQVDVEKLNSDPHHRYYRKALKEQVDTLQSSPSLLKQSA